MFPKLRFAKQDIAFPILIFDAGIWGEVARMARAGEKFDLALVMGTFAYVESWPEFVRLRRGCVGGCMLPSTFLQTQ